MAREPDELVEMRRLLGEQLAALCQAAELSQGQLAMATYRDRTSVAHIEKGRSRGSERFWKLADERCHAQGMLLAGFRAWEAARQDHAVRVREALLAQARTKAEQLRATTATTAAPQGGPGGPETIAGDITAGSSTPGRGVRRITGTSRVGR